MKILIIDDSPADRELTIRLLERDFAGTEFAEIGRKREFYAALEAGAFDAVLTDFRLHWADGFLILSEVRARQPHVPVVFITESGSEEIAVEAMKAGLSDYVLKQHPHRLPVALRESLQRARLQQQYDQALTELQIAHAGLRRAADELEQRVVERTAELARTNDDLRSEMAERRRVEEERERLLAENRQQRELLEHLIEAAPIGIAMLHADDFRYEFANPAYVAITGRLARERGLVFGSGSAELTRLRDDLLTPACRAGQPVSIREFERDAVGPPGMRDYWDIDAVPLQDEQDNVATILLLVNDVTQKVLARTQVEELALQLAAERRFLDSIMDNVPVAITYLDKDCVYRQCNRAAAEQMGRPVNQILGYRLREVIPNNPELWEAVESVLRSGQPYPEPTITLRWSDRPEEGERHYMVAYLPDKDASGQVRGVFAEGQDITEVVRARQRLEELAQELVAARDQLELRVQERTAELEASRQQLRALSRHLVTVQENERKALSRELHDRSAQSMTTLKLGLAMLTRKADDARAVRARVGELAVMVDAVLTDLHELAVNLRPSALDRYGLASAIGQYVDTYRRQNQIEVILSVAELEGERLSDEVETALYRIVQESLMNIARHAGATRAEIVAKRSPETVSLSVSDNGAGFDVEDALARGRLGLLGMRERAEMLGGRLSIASNQGTGTSVYLEVPREG